MKSTLHVVKRSNGCYGIYVDGKLVSNSFLTDTAETLINLVLIRASELKERPDIIFTDDDTKFQSNLPKLEDYLCAKQSQS